MPKKLGWMRSLTVGSVLILSHPSAVAQITPDETLGAERSRLSPNVPINGAGADRIEGGATRSRNLFHSFQEFNVRDGQRVYFANPTGIDNILTRVTGSTASNILGTLGVDGSANLFLLNPNGIIFGQNAQLDVRGSFVGTTASGVQFGNQGEFSVTNSKAPGLLTVNPSALLFDRINAGSIVHQARNAPTIPLLSPQQGSRFLVGGNITLDGGQIVAIDNRLELGGLAGEGSVGLTGSGNELQLNFPQGVPRADVTLQNNAIGFTTGGGAIAVHARNLNLSGNSLISSFLRAGEGSEGTQANNVTVNATGSVTLDSSSTIANQGLNGALGDTGDIAINAQSLQLANQSEIKTSSDRNRGNIRLNTIDDVTLDASLLTTVGLSGSIGKSGDITLNAQTINLLNKSVISSGVFEQGQSGKISLQAQDAISLSGGSIVSSISGALLPPGTVNRNTSGDVNIRARSLSLSGDTNTIKPAVISSENRSEGRAGDIRITTDESVSLTNLSTINTNTTGQGDGGTIQMETRSLTLSNGSDIFTSAFGQGNSGNLLINASDSVSLNGIRFGINPSTGEELRFINSITTSALGSGNGGRLAINTRRLSVRDGGSIGTEVNVGQSGRGGDLTIQASDSVEVVGTTPNPDNLIPSSISTATLGSGNGGNLTITTHRLSIRDGGSVSAGVTTAVAGRSGNITVNASESVEVEGTSLLNPGIVSILLTSTLGSGDAGNITINTGRLSVRRGAVVGTSALTGSTGRTGDITVNAADSIEVVGSNGEISNFTVGSFGQGQAGNMTVSTPRLILQDQGFIDAVANSVDGGNITLNTNLLLLRRSSSISTTAGIGIQAGGNGGNITINANNGFLIAVPSENSNINADAFSGSGGSVRITARGIFGIQAQPKRTPQSDITASSQLGVQGQVAIEQPEVQPTQGAVELPVDILDASNQVAQTCPRGSGTRSLGTFVITGRGSLPSNPMDTLTGTTATSPLATLDGQPSQTANASSVSAITAANAIAPPELIEAQGWSKTPDGKVALVAAATSTPPNPRQVAGACPVSARSH
jgi:filamentous hemagglutinin family protein